MIRNLLILGCLIYITRSLNIKLKPYQQFCLRMNGGDKFEIFFGSSGINDERVRFTILHKQQQILRKQYIKQFNQQVQLPAGQIQMCFYVDDAHQKQITFDFYKHTDPIKTMIDKKDVLILQGALMTAANQLSQFSRNQQFHIQRDQIHKITLETSQSRIKWAGIIKILFLIGSALIQLWIMKGFFKQAQPYQPVNS